MTLRTTFAAVALVALAFAAPVLAGDKLAQADRARSKSAPIATAKVEPEPGEKVRLTPRIITERVGALVA